jgi:guanylate kinase
MSFRPHKPLVFIISAPSGSGKSTLVKQLLNSIPDLDFSISYTTRSPRGSEVNGKQYYFVSRAEFEQMVRDDDFLEHAEVFGNYYGTSRRFLRDAELRGRDLLLDIDVQGAAQIQQKVPDATSIFILPPDRKTLEERLRKRSEDCEQVIQRRLITASREIENYQRYNYILLNDDLAESSNKLRSIVQAERALKAGGSLSDDEAGAVACCRLENARAWLPNVLASFKSVGQPAGSSLR